MYSSMNNGAKQQQQHWNQVISWSWRFWSSRRRHNTYFVIVKSSDTDDAAICSPQCVLWFRTGVKQRLRYIPIHEMSMAICPEMCNALQSLHALTGCDSTSDLTGIGKRKKSGATAWRNHPTDRWHYLCMQTVCVLPVYNNKISNNNGSKFYMNSNSTNYPI